MSKMKKLTQEYLKECLMYEPDTGIFTWKKRPLNHFKNSRGCNSFNSKLSGKMAGRISHYGYIEIGLMKFLYKAHRLAFLYMEGYTPENEIDHKDGNRSNNIWSNLREVSHQCNMQNQKLSKKNTSGIAGVFFNKRYNKCKWVVNIKISQKNKCIGRFEKLEDAAMARYKEEKTNPNWKCTVKSSAREYLVSKGVKV